MHQNKNPFLRIIKNAGIVNMRLRHIIEESGLAILDALTEARLACGAGVALRLGGVARVELNYCVPLKARQGDVTAQGIQFGIAAHFL